MEATESVGVRLCECGCGRPTAPYTRSDPRKGIVQGQPTRFCKGHHNRLANSAVPGMKYCRHCQTHKPETAEHFYPFDDGSGFFRATCRVCRARRAAEWASANPEKLRCKYRRAKRRARRLNPWPTECARKRYTTKLKMEMIAAYGGKCACCGITEPAFLTLEHKRRDGQAHRDRLRSGGGVAIWLDLKRRGWPQDDYTVLCWNCNCATRLGRPCPHTINRSVETLA